ncbi:hypothetical protein niasHS_010065 [Heterodera schachtii]|uniref:Non-structural maintenance of chromosomes element 1 homolog n=1 Tax=Heterodera schachtii TaxID=97005 RepID=A0ABD2J088_HETSC
MALAPPRGATINTLLGHCSEYGDIHREFLQFLIKVRYVESSEVGKIFLKICNAVENDRFKAIKSIGTEENFLILESLLQMLNTKLSPLGLRVVQVADEFARRKEFLILISELHFRHGLRSAGPLAEDELAMFYRWQNLMFLTECNAERATNRMASTAMDETNSDDDGTENAAGDGELAVGKALLYAKRNGWTMQKAQKLIDKLNAEGWVVVVKRSDDPRESGVIRLHPSAVAELEPMLENYFHLPKCALCRHPIVVRRLSFTCPSCESSLHGNCMLRELEFPSKCPGDDCDETIEEEVLDAFGWDPDELHIPPRRSAQRAGRSSSDLSQLAGTSQQHRQSSSVLRGTANSPFASLREF